MSLSLKFDSRRHKVNIGKDIKIGHRLKISFWSILEGSKKILILIDPRPPHPKG